MNPTYQRHVEVGQLEVLNRKLVFVTDVLRLSRLQG